MGVTRIMTGTPWQPEKMVRQEGDSRRHRSRCVYYDKETKHCPKVVSKCVGAAHCIYYKENIIEQSVDVIKPKKTQQKKPVVIDKNLNNKIRVVGTEVINKAYGKGKVIEVKGNDVVIEFDKGKKANYNIDLCVKNNWLTLV